jgi:hypothetical protein
VKASEVRALIKSVVQAHATYNNWYSIWSVAKDQPSECDYPAVFWGQWTARLNLEAELGAESTQLVRLVFVDSVATDRTPEERDAASEAAHEAATQVMLKLWQDNAGLRESIADISMTTPFDEGSALETGVLLQFTVRTGICYDSEAFPEPEE